MATEERDLDLPRLGFDAFPEAEVIAMSDKPYDISQQKLLQVFHLSKRRMNIWRGIIRRHLREPAGFAAETTMSTGKNNAPNYQITGERMMLWQEEKSNNTLAVCETTGRFDLIFNDIPELRMPLLLDADGRPRTAPDGRLLFDHPRLLKTTVPDPANPEAQVFWPHIRMRQHLFKSIIIHEAENMKNTTNLRRLKNEIKYRDTYKGAKAPSTRTTEAPTSKRARRTRDVVGFTPPPPPAIGRTRVILYPGNTDRREALAYVVSSVMDLLPRPWTHYNAHQGYPFDAVELDLLMPSVREMYAHDLGGSPMPDGWLRYTGRALAPGRPLRHWRVSKGHQLGWLIEHHTRLDGDAMDIELEWIPGMTVLAFCPPIHSS